MIPSTPETSPCPVCRSERTSPLEEGRTPFIECSDCGLLFQEGPPEGQSRLYEDPETDESARRIAAEEPLRRPYYRRLVQWISTVGIPKEGRLLEIGCGPGGLLAELAGTGWSAEGIEPSPRLRGAAIERLGPDLPIHSCRLEEAEPFLKHRLYSAILAIDVIEHLGDPALLPGLAYSWLAPGGVLFLQTPNAGSIRRYLQGEAWEQLAPDEHLLLHTRKSLDLLLKESGFTDIRIHTISGSGGDSSIRRGLMGLVGGMLSQMDLGNALRAAARKEEE